MRGLQHRHAEGRQALLLRRLRLLCRQQAGAEVRLLAAGRRSRLLLAL